MKVSKLLVPAVFLLLLGLGNIIVGLYKGAQYSQVLSELSALEQPSELENASPLTRITLDASKSARLEKRRSRAVSRLDFYNLVLLGGKVMLCLSLLLFSGLGIQLALGKQSFSSSLDLGTFP